MREARAGLAAYFYFYNHQRPHQALDNQTPAEVHAGYEPLAQAA
ncbi:MAG: integrase core domain-containing protein [Sinobacteraceae bacterium]|nr:integrase core domain-containing protein [Nevskiaceae bacterium]